MAKEIGSPPEKQEHTPPPPKPCREGNKCSFNLSYLSFFLPLFRGAIRCLAGHAERLGGGERRKTAHSYETPPSPSFRRILLLYFLTCPFLWAQGASASDKETGIFPHGTEQCHKLRKVNLSCLPCGRQKERLTSRASLLRQKLSKLLARPGHEYRLSWQHPTSSCFAGATTAATAHFSLTMANESRSWG